MKPFSEVARFELGNESNSFYATGSTNSVGETPGSFSNTLSNKEQLRLSFSVLQKTSMLSNSSSIYYLNNSTNSWNLPVNSVNDHAGPFDKFAIGTQWNPVSGTTGEGFTRGTIYIEDSKCFDAYGNSTISGSQNIFDQYTGGIGNLIFYNQSNKYIGNPVNKNKIGATNPLEGQSRIKSDAIEAVLENFPKSVQRSETYSARQEETFQINIDRPFLLEKAVFEIPVCLGPTWFNDKTVTSISAATGTYAGNQPFNKTYVYYNKGGPALTVALFCQKSYGTELIRDLILKGTITHTNDSEIFSFARILPAGISERNCPSMSVEALGLKNSNTAVIVPDNSFYTGSVIVKTTASVSNGISGMGYSVSFITQSLSPKTSNQAVRSRTFYPEEILSAYRTLFSQKQLSLASILPENFGSTLISSIDTFGRGMTGFSPSGASIFGGEYVTNQSVNAQGDPIVENPYYMEDAEKIEQSLTQISSTINSLLSRGYVSPIPQDPEAWIFNTFDSDLFVAKKESPYLINPGDRLVLAISKTRPAISASGHNVPDSASADIGRNVMHTFKNIFGDTSGHDITLNTGSINITFYGSYVRAGDSYIP